MSVSVSVVVPARNAEGTIGLTLSALSRQQLEGEFEVIVALDGPDARTRAAVEAAELEARIVEVPAAEASGPGGARNAGVATSNAEVIAFTDADCEPAPDWLARGLEAIAAGDLVQGTVLPMPGSAIGPFDRSVWVAGDTGLFETANLFVRRQLFERLGGFEDWVPMPRESAGGRPKMGEDLLFGWRARREGARTSFCAEALVHHAVFRRTGAEYVAERARLRWFPLIVRHVPELRDTFLYKRYFLNRRSAAFDVAMAGVALALARRTRWPLLAAIPYARLGAPERFDRAALEVALANLAADAVSFGALAWGSVRARELLL